MISPLKFSMNLPQVMLYNTLISLIHRSLGDLLKALKGLVVMSDALERMSTSVFNNSVPDMWANKAYPSLKPLGSWVADLLQVCFLSEVRFINLLSLITDFSLSDLLTFHSRK